MKQECTKESSSFTHVPDCEAALIGAISHLGAEGLKKVQDKFDLNPDCFCDARHQLIWKAILKLDGSDAPVTYPTLIDHIQNHSAVEHFVEIYCEYQTAGPNVLAYADIVAKAAERRVQLSDVEDLARNLSTTLRHCRLRFTEQSLLLWMSRVD